MLGTLLNVAGILIGGIVGLTRRKPMTPAHEAMAKIGLAALITFYGLRLTWMSLSGPFPHLLKQIVVLLLAMMLGKLAGRLLGLQKTSNKIGGWAREVMGKAKPRPDGRIGEAFQVCAALFCASPLGIHAAIVEGVTTPPYYYPLAIKGAIDGLAAVGFVSLFGWEVLLSALPVLVFQGTVTLLSSQVAPFLSAHALVASVQAVGGMLIFSVALVMLGLKRIELADYLPSILFAPLIEWLWR